MGNFNLPIQEVYCPGCFDPFFADGAEHECPNCHLKFDLNDPNLMGVVVKEPGKKAHLRFIFNNLSSMQRLVNGDLQAVYWGQIINLEDHYMYCNEEGKYQSDCLPNIELPGDIVVGTIFISRNDDEGNSVSVTKQDVQSIIFSLDSRAYGK